MIVELVPSGNHPNHPIRNILLQNILLSSQYTMVFRIYTLYIVLYFAMMFYMHCKGLFLQVLEPSFYTFLSFTMKHSQSLITFSRGQFYNLQCSLDKQTMPPIIFPSLVQISTYNIQQEWHTQARINQCIRNIYIFSSSVDAMKHYPSLYILDACRASKTYVADNYYKTCGSNHT